MRPVRVFYSYSHRDEPFRDELAKHLALLKRAGVIEAWHDRKIAPGDEWAHEIDRNLDLADVILLLVSADFIASDYCFDVELTRAMDHDAQGTARVIPIIVRSVSWRAAPFGKLQALPTDGRPVDTWENADMAWTDIAEGIGAVIEEMQRRLPDRDESEMPTKLRALMGRHVHEYTLTIEQGLNAGQRLEPEAGDKLVVGRGELADICLPDDDLEASRHHAWLDVCHTGIVAHDLRSKNGTFVNDEPIETRKLRCGDRVRCGATVIRVDEAPDLDRTRTVMVPSRTGRSAMSRRR